MSEQVYGPEPTTSADQCFVGRKLDAGKPRWSLLPWNALGAVVSVLEFGARKYAPGNWRHVPDARTRYFDAAQTAPARVVVRREERSRDAVPAPRACAVLLAVLVGAGA